MAIHGNLWLQLLRHLNAVPLELVMNEWPRLSDMIYPRLLNERSTCCSAISQLLELGGDWVLSRVISRVITVLESEDVRMTTREDVEIAETPPTQLWHRQCWNM